MVAYLYPWALGFLSVASYDSPGYGGNILSHLSCWVEICMRRIETRSLHRLLQGSASLMYFVADTFKKDEIV
jgi:hypothetical protein